jgi:hypothetical protein
VATDIEEWRDVGRNTKEEERVKKFEGEKGSERRQRERCKKKNIKYNSKM